MPALAILNPRPRKRKAAGKRKRRRKPMTARQLKFFGPRKSKKARGAKRKARSKSKVVIVQSNPKGKAMAKKTRRRRKAKVFTHKSVRRMRRNPRSLEAGFVKNTLLPAAIGAGGAIGADAILNWAPIPVQFKTGGFGVALRIASALLVGAAVGAVSTREAGEEAAAGGVIVTLYGLSRGFIAQQQGWGAWMNGGAGAGQGAAMNRYVPNNGMRRYIPMNGVFQPPAMRSPNRQGLGYMNPARIGAPAANRATMRYLSTQ